MTSDEYKECVDILAEYAKTKMLCLDERQKKLLKKFAEEHIKISC